MPNAAVIGLGFGDEGKGAVTDWLCSQDQTHTSVVRFSGGHQAAHTVNIAGAEHVFSNFGSGTLRGCPTYWGPQCTFDPVGFCRELEVLKGTEACTLVPSVFVNPQCRVVTPYDVLANHTSPERAHGTTGTGFWKTIERNQNGVTLTFQELIELSSNTPITPFRIKMAEISRYYNLCGEGSPFLNDFYNAVIQVTKLLSRRVVVIGDTPPLGNVVFEGSQGLLLDKDIGFFPHVTPSKTNLANILSMGCLPPKELYLVTRAYQTRHGAGPMTNEGLPLDAEEAYESATKHNPFQGSLRRTVLDLHLLRYAVEKGVDADCAKYGITKNLVVTCLDQMVTLSLTDGKGVETFKTREGFVEKIAKSLGIGGAAYTNTSPRFGNIKRVDFKRR